ncbi:virulence-associated E family protein [Neoroseomonas soli]|uniref:Virulence-associated protein E-like domain-containing protein n=1 Tax=Neoroseomonas soli TaxID=1081025 RepID=A0A9X9X0I0_9PROT|nr:virulence-associated E family protein [Neoroseomonas soli]MBR0672909.1 hypothetical protein [Neoroseomonas soli]
MPDGSQFSNSSSAPPGGLPIDGAQLAEFCRVMFEHAPADTWVNLQARTNNFDPKAAAAWTVEQRAAYEKARGKSLGGWLPVSDLDRVIKRVLAMAEEAANAPWPGMVFCPPVATFKTQGVRAKGADKANLAAGLAIQVDLDDRNPPEALARLEKMLGAATLVVHSGGTTDAGHPKTHAYWRLASPAVTDADKELLREARNLAGKLAGGDDSSTNAVHPIPWPGSWHTKGEPVMCRIVRSGGTDIADLGAVVAALRASSPRHASSSTGGQREGARAPNDALVREALRAIPYAYSTHDEGQPDWLKVAGAIHNATDRRPEGLLLLIEWYAAKTEEELREGGALDEIARLTSKERAKECADRWARLITSPFDLLGWKQLQRWAHEAKAPGLILTGKGAIVRSEANLLGVLSGPEFPKVGLNLFSGDITLLDRPEWDPPGEWKPRAWTDADDGDATIKLQRLPLYSWATKNLTALAIEKLARENRFDPVADYLRRLSWNGTPRIDTWLTDFLGVEDSELHRAYARKWLISAVARAMRPGCKVDTVLVLEGPQGIRKSTTLRILFGDEHFTDQIPDLRDKDANAQLRGIWGLEFAEFDALRSAEESRIKAFLTITADRYRAAYDRRLAVHPRRCVFAGTLNHTSDYLGDETGARRFWMVECAVGWEKGRKVDLAAFAAARDQLWAEAAHRFNAGEEWWLPPELEELQEAEATQRQREDPWQGAIANHMLQEQKRETTARDILVNALQLNEAQHTKSNQKRISAIMLRMGWKRQAVRLPMETDPKKKGAAEKGYKAPDNWPGEWAPPDGWDLPEVAQKKREKY